MFTEDMLYIGSRLEKQLFARSSKPKVRAVLLLLLYRKDSFSARLDVPSLVII